jgi:hypothetical protein
MTAAPKPLRYLLGGLLIGGFWYLNRSRPAAEEALRTIVVFAVLMTLLRAKLKSQSVNVHLIPLVGAKAILVTMAALVQESLKDSVGNPQLVVAIGLGIAVALVGSVGDRYFFSRGLPPAAATTDQRAL